ncbi:MAG: hypothetical protein WBD36_15705 [Bacteroidota bacterium]
MKTIVASLCFTFASYELAQAQFPEITDYSLHAGVAFPVGPPAFYDYWKPGFAVGGALGFPLMRSWSIQAGIEYAGFSLDADRFLKGIKRDPKDNSITGGNSSFLVFSGSMRFLPVQEQPLPLFFCGGVHVLYSSVAQSRANFSGFEVIQNRESFTSAGIFFGGGVEFSTKSSMNVFFEARYMFALLRNQRANTNASFLRTGVRVGL